MLITWANNPCHQRRSVLAHGCHWFTTQHTLLLTLVITRCPLAFPVCGQDTSELFFEDVRLPSSALLGEANKGFYYLMQELPQERLLIATMGQAACEWMFEETRSYVCQRKAFGRTLSKLQVGWC